MEEREGDARIYVISGLFFCCIVGGGVFLCLYIFLPASSSTAWYPIAGMILVSIPWAFWVIAYLSTCFKRRGVGQIGLDASPAPAPTSGVTTVARTSNVESPVRSPGDERRVHFGAVCVLGDEENAGEAAVEEGHLGVHRPEGDHGESCSAMTSNHQVASRECEMPLTLSVSP